MPPKKGTIAKTSSLTVNDALKLAATNPAFAHQLIKSPAKFKAQFNLSLAEIAALRAVRPKGPTLPKAGWSEG